MLLALCLCLPPFQGVALDLRPPSAPLTAGSRAELPDLPLAVRSEERGDLLAAEVEGRLEFPFAEVAAALADPAAWCDFLPLTLNVKSCTWSDGPEGPQLSIYAGRKTYQPTEATTRMDYRFRVQEPAVRQLRILLEAPAGPLGIRDSQIQLTVVEVEGGTALRLVSSSRSSLRSRVATDTYLATLGREKVGFSVTGDGPRGPQFVRGVRGMIERNVVRYYLALQSYLDTRKLPEPERFETRLLRWFSLTEVFRQQLHEMDQGEYLRAKRRERQDQARLQFDVQGQL